jgi:hypothetical protein
MNVVFSADGNSEHWSCIYLTHPILIPLTPPDYKSHHSHIIVKLHGVHP